MVLNRLRGGCGRRGAGASVACLVATCLLLMAGGVQAQSTGEKLTPRQDAERRYADKLLQRANQRISTSRWKGARSDLRDAIEARGIAYGEDDERVADLYLLLARTQVTEVTRERKYNRKRLSAAQEDFEEAIRIYEGLENPPADKLLESIVYYGDAVLMTGDSERAVELYLRGWDLLEQKASRKVASDYFKKPIRLFAGDLRGDRSDKPQLVSLRFVMGADGMVSGIEDDGSTAEPQLVARVGSFLEDTRFRPRIVAREPRATPAFIKLQFPVDGSPPVELRE
jgi:tetratricopeptide (TPR) repeat protein